MTRCLGTTIALALLACGPAPVRSTVPPVSIAPPLATTAPTEREPRMWLRGGMLRDAPEGKDLVIASPALVELVAPDRLRVVDSSPIIEGVLPTELALRPDDRYGLGLYVTRETALHLGAPDGPTIGRVVPGVYLPVLAYNTIATEVRVSGYYDLAPLGPDGYRHSGDLRAYVATADLGLDETSIVAPVLDGRRIRSARLELEVDPASLTNGFTKTDCADLRILEERIAPDGRRLERMAQYRDGIEVAGWAHEDQDGARGGGVCPPRAVDGSKGYGWEGGARYPPLPPDFVAAEGSPPEGLDLATLVRTQRAIWIPFVDDAGILRCQSYRFGGTRSAARIQGWTGRFRIFPRGQSFFIHFTHFQIAQTTDERLVILAGVNRSGMQASAYHPDDAEHWFFTEAGCQRDATIEHASLLQSRR